MNNIKSFNEFSNFVWEPKRVPNEEQYMPDQKNADMYKKSVEDALISMLTDLYQLDGKTAKQVNKIIWTTYLKEWENVLKDCLVNWDTPEICAQKCINSLKSFLNLE